MLWKKRKSKGKETQRKKMNEKCEFEYFFFSFLPYQFKCDVLQYILHQKYLKINIP